MTRTCWYVILHRLKSVGLSDVMGINCQDHFNDLLRESANNSEPWRSPAVTLVLTMWLWTHQWCIQGAAAFIFVTWRWRAPIHPRDESLLKHKRTTFDFQKKSACCNFVTSCFRSNKCDLHWPPIKREDMHPNSSPSEGIRRGRGVV